jgi:hypothetical protein
VTPEIEQRSWSEDVPFGNVYLRDGVRVGYHCADPDKRLILVWYTRGWPATSRDLSDAMAALRTRF